MEKIEIVVSHTVGQKEVYATARVGDKVLQAVARCNDSDVFDLFLIGKSTRYRFYFPNFNTGNFYSR